MGIPLHRCIFAHPHTWYFVEEILVPSPPKLLAPTTASLEKVREAILPSSVPPKPIDQVIYISRKGATRRAVVNEKQVLSTLEDVIAQYNKAAGI